MRHHGRGSPGFAVAVVLLVSVVALAAAVSTASIAAISARRVANLEQRASAALFAAESGLNTLWARSKTEAYSFDGFSSVGDWLANTPGLSSYFLPAGAEVQLSVVPVTGQPASRVTIRSIGVSPDGNSTRVILQDFVVALEPISPSLFADAALVTKTALKTNARFSTLIGLTRNEADWRFDGTLSQAREGDYVEVGGVLYRVMNVQDGVYTLEGRPAPGPDDLDDDGEPMQPTVVVYDTEGESDDPDAIKDNPDVIIIPFALADPGGFSPLSALQSTITVTDVRVFSVGTVIEVGGDGTAGTGNIGTVEAVDEASGQLTVDWSQAGRDAPEGSPIRKVVLSAIAEGGCPTDKQWTSEKLPQGCEEQDLGILWEETFGGISKTDLRDIARGDLDADDFEGWEGTEGAYYGGGDWPSSVGGLVWIDGAQTKGRNNELCGSGIVILNTGASLDDDPDDRINLTTAGCDFSGILYVIGQLKLVGNLDNFSGAIFVEGPGGITEAEGTGTKSLYDPIAIREALELLPPKLEPRGLFAAIPASWRISQLP